MTFPESFDLWASGVSYRPLDNLELTLGWYLFGGKNGTPLGGQRDQDQLYLKAKLSF